ncbi:MAG: sugar transferase [Planctomycetaceae bacterium]|nr:sugar transferase [Planctomycetaceae bacterium]
MSHRSTQTFYQRHGKRVFDIVVSGLLLCLLAPVIGVLWFIVRRQLGSPAFFRQRRPGKGGRVFEMVKFRSMTDARDSSGNLLPDQDRLPRFGQLLRSTSLDELPELWNVLKGEMSLVGPRPLLERYLDRYTPHQARRHEVAPGVTGWAQVNGRNALSWEEKFELDVWYVDHQSLALDLKILWLTFWKVIKRDSVSAAGEATMSEFLGTDTEKRAA